MLRNAVVVMYLPATLLGTLLVLQIVCVRFKCRCVHVSSASPCRSARACIAETYLSGICLLAALVHPVPSETTAPAASQLHPGVGSVYICGGGAQHGGSAGRLEQLVLPFKPCAVSTVSAQHHHKAGTSHFMRCPAFQRQGATAGIARAGPASISV